MLKLIERRLIYFITLSDFRDFKMLSFVENWKIFY